MRAGTVVVVVASALPTGFFAVDRGDEFTLYALLKLVVVAVPFAVVLSLAVRFVVRRVLPSLQESGPRGPQRGGGRQLRRGPTAQRADPEGAVRHEGGRRLPAVRRAARDR